MDATPSGEPGPRNMPADEFDGEDAEGWDAIGARKAAHEAAKEFAEDAERTKKSIRVQEDAMEDGVFSIRLRTTSRSLTPELHAALADRYWSAEFLGEVDGGPGRYEWLIETDDDSVHENVY